MRFGLVVLLWLTFWSQLGQASSVVVSALKEWLASGEETLEVMGEDERLQMDNGMICIQGEFPYSSDPDWTTKCWRSI